MPVPGFLATHLGRTPSVSTIPAGTSFLEAVARPIADAYRDDPLGLSDLTIFLPNQRAKRTIARLLASMGGGGASVLPRLRTLGEIDEADLLLSGEPPAAAIELAPPADLMARRLILARLLKGKAEALGQQADWPTALVAADSLARFLDGLHRDDVPFSVLETFTPTDLQEPAAGHWRQQLAFLNVLGEQWPRVMAENGWMEPAARQSALLGALGDVIAADTEGPPVIVAGSLGTARATAAFMAKVAGAPRGHVILPGVDTTLDPAIWERIDDPHPQSVFRSWLREHLGGADHRIIPPWTEGATVNAPRREFLSLALRPADATDSWYDGFAALNRDGRLVDACDGLRLLAADTPDEEAALIALLLRETIAEDGKTAMLVTPDRDLARQVCSKLRAWDIDVDDAGGTPLTGTFRGTFLRACAAWFDSPSSTVALMQLLNHDLATWSQLVDVVRRAAREIDRVLRGPRLPTWSVVCERISDRVTGVPEIGPLLDQMGTHLAAFEAAQTLGEQIGCLIKFAEWLAADEKTPGPGRLWRYEDGEALAPKFDALLASPFLPDRAPPGQFSAMIDALLGGGSMRRRGVGHPRLFVYGLVEARLQSADLTILAGLNEGVWPDGADEDAFLSRSMRAALGLSSPEQAIGRAAHDFEQHAMCPDVVLSRSARHGRSPSTPSRWWVRIESFLHAGNLLDAVDDTARLRALRQLRERPDAVEEIRAPNPAPPADVRPDKYRVTEIGTLIRDPYAIYGRRILRLEPWALRDAEIGFRERGIVCHALYHQAAEAGLTTPGAAQGLRTLIAEILIENDLPAEYMVLWRRALNRALDAYLAYEQTVRMEGEYALAEEKAVWPFEAAGKPIELIGKPDRIDRRHDSTVSIVDFKGASGRTMKQETAFDPQLSLLALMAGNGVFGDIGGRDVYRIAYLPMLSGKLTAPVFGDLAEDGKDREGAMSGDDLAKHLAETERRFFDLMTEVSSGERPFPSQVYPEKTHDQGDFDRLARRPEWSVRGGDGDTADGD